MIDLADAYADWLAAYVRETRNFAPLANWLRSNGAISYPLQETLADIVGGNLKPSGKRRMHTDGELPGLIKTELSFWKSELLLHAHNPTELAKGGVVAFTWPEVEAVLLLAGFTYVPTKNGQCGEAASAIVCWLHQLNPYELDKVKRKKAFDAMGILPAQSTENNSV